MICRLVASFFLIALMLGACGRNDEKLRMQAETETELVNTLVQTKKISMVDGERRKREIWKRYDNGFDEFDESYWAKKIEAADRLSKNQISKEQYDVIISEAHAQRRLQQRQIEMAEKAAKDAKDAKWAAERAANRSLTCKTYQSGTVCE